MLFFLDLLMPFFFLAFIFAYSPLGLAMDHTITSLGAMTRLTRFLSASSAVDKSSSYFALSMVILSVGIPDLL